MNRSQKKYVWICILLFSGVISIIDFCLDLIPRFLNLDDNALIISSLLPLIEGIITIIAICKLKNKRLENGLIVTVSIFSIIDTIINMYNCITVIKSWVDTLLSCHSISNDYIIFPLLTNIISFIIMPIGCLPAIFSFSLLNEKLPEQTNFEKKLCWYGILMFKMFNVGLNAISEFIQITQNITSNLILAAIFTVVFVLEIIVLVKVLKNYKNFVFNKDLSNVKISLPVLLLVIDTIILLYDCISLTSYSNVLIHASENLAHLSILIIMIGDTILRVSTTIVLVIMCFKKKDIEEVVSNNTVKESEYVVEF